MPLAHEHQENAEAISSEPLIRPLSIYVLTRVNSPADVEIGSATRDGLAGDLSFTSAIISSSFTVANTVVNGINKKPNQFTGGEGPATGGEVLVSIDFVTPVLLGPNHYFFRPEVLLSDGDFLWLSAPKPIVAPGKSVQSRFTNLDSKYRS